MADNLGTNESGTVKKPRFKILVNDEDWSEEFLFGDLQQWGFNRNGSFNLTFDLDRLGNVDPATGAVDPGSKLGKILQPHTTPKRDKVQIYLGYADDTFGNDSDQEQLPHVFDGVMDNIGGEQDNGTVVFCGRDRSAILQESFTHAQFRNKSVKSAVEEIAEKHGMEVDIVDSGTQLGTVYDEERISFEHIPSHGFNDWELLNRFADHDAFTVYVTGNTLHYRPIEDGKETIVFRYGENIQTCKWRKNFSVAQSRVGIELISTSVKKKDSAYVTAGTVTKSPGHGDSATYRFTDVPSKDPETLGILAESLALLYSQLEKIVSITTTGFNSQTIENLLALEGSGTDFDGTYRIITVNWKFGFELGWTAEITGLFLPDGGRLRTHRKRQRASLTRI